MRIQNKLNDLNFNNKSNRYQVGFQKNTWGNLEYRKSIFIENKEGTFNADPFVIEKDNKSYCFVECFDYSEKKAKINVYELSEKNTHLLEQLWKKVFTYLFPIFLNLTMIYT